MNIVKTLIGISLFAVLATAQAELTEIKDFGDNPGNLRMYAYVPENLPEGAPLVVALHGCSQTASDFDREPGWADMADRAGFALLFPGQHSSNQELLCFNWFNPKHQKRGKGEPASIVGMIDHMLATYGLDAERVYVAGLSAGGAMTAVLLATYPERFAGGAIIAGIPYGCATDDFSLLTCMGGDNKSAKAWGDKVRKASDYAGPRPVVSIWHGSKDSMVQFKNAGELVEQWSDVLGLENKPTRIEAVAGRERQVFEKDGRALMEYWAIQGMDHGMPIAPGDGAGHCGEAGSWALDAGICAAERIVVFWGIANP